MHGIIEVRDRQEENRKEIASNIREECSKNLDYIDQLLEEINNDEVYGMEK